MAPAGEAAGALRALPGYLSRLILHRHRSEPNSSRLKPETVDKVRIFVSSPTDVSDERDQITLVVDELNRAMHRRRGRISPGLRRQTAHIRAARRIGSAGV